MYRERKCQNKKTRSQRTTGSFLFFLLLKRVNIIILFVPFLVLPSLNNKLPKGLPESHVDVMVREIEWVLFVTFRCCREKGRLGSYSGVLERVVL